MNNQLRLDAAARPDLWQWTGGGDMYDSETIAAPVADDTDEESVDAWRSWFHEKGVAPEYLVFQEGVFCSAIRQTDGAVVELDPTTFEEIAVFGSLAEWYERLIRPAFATTYRMPPPRKLDG